MALPWQKKVKKSRSDKSEKTENESPLPKPRGRPKKDQEV